MVFDIVSITLGILFGVATGFFFERRATRSAQRQSAELEKELESVRHSVYSMGGSAVDRPAAPSSADLVSLLKERALAIQDPEGKLVKGILVSEFMGRGYDPREIDAAIEVICGEGAARCSGKWLEMA